MNTKNNKRADKMTMRKSESGRTLTEMLGVLAIMGVLTIGGIAGFNWAMDRWRANRIIEGVEERALVGSRLRLSGMNRTMEIADAVVAQTGGTIEDYATTVLDTGKNGEKTYFSVEVAGVSPQVCENVMNLNWQLPVEVYAGEDKYTGDTAICAGEGTVDLTFVFAADLITKKNVQVVDRNNPTCRPTQVWTCKENEDNHYNCCTAGMLCRADGDTLPTGVFSENKGDCPRGTHQCRNNQCVCRKSCPAGQNQDPKTCQCSSQTCETGVIFESNKAEYETKIELSPGKYEIVAVGAPSSTYGLAFDRTGFYFTTVGGSGACLVGTFTLKDATTITVDGGYGLNQTTREKIECPLVAGARYYSNKATSLGGTGNTYDLPGVSIKGGSIDLSIESGTEIYFTNTDIDATQTNSGDVATVVSYKGLTTYQIFDGKPGYLVKNSDLISYPEPANPKYPYGLPAKAMTKAELFSIPFTVEKETPFGNLIVKAGTTYRSADKTGKNGYVKITKISCD